MHIFGLSTQQTTFLVHPISAGLDVAFLAKAIERVADHAKNISEYVIHIVQGQDPRHAG